MTDEKESIMNGSRTLPLAFLVVALVAGCGSTDFPATGTGTGGGSGGSGGTGGTGGAGGSGGDNDAGNGECQRAPGALLPWKVGNKWTYTVVEMAAVSQKVTTIEAVEMVGGMGPNAGKMANRVVTKKGLMDQTISWQVLEGQKVVRYREQSFGATSGMLELEEYWEPYKLHIDGSPERMGDRKTWVETYRETKLAVNTQPVTATAMDAWQVAAECDEVQVQGTTYKAVKFTKTSGDTKTYWYVPGVGKVKETGAQTEELIKFEEGP
jgi:hypothetical protein